MFSSRLLIIFLSALLFLTCCTPALAQSAAAPVSFDFDFRNGTLGWQAGFSDYPPGADNGSYELRGELRNLPPDINGGATGFYMQGHNRSDDLFMFLKRRLNTSDGIVAGQAYEVNFTLVLASNAPQECGGIGGSPGESVVLKVGATPAEPLALLDASLPTPNLRMNVDKSNQTEGGIAASRAGDIATNQPCVSPTHYMTIQRTHQHTSPVTANAKGELWLLVGTDSGFEGLTTLYYQRIAVSLLPVNAPPAPVILTDADTGRAAALDSVTLARDPFAVVNPSNLSQDQRTRLSLFAYNLELKADEDASAVTAQAEDAQQKIYPLAVEYVGTLHNFGWITQVVVRLPDELKNANEAWLTIKLRGLGSNKTLVRLKPSANNSILRPDGRDSNKF